MHVHFKNGLTTCSHKARICLLVVLWDFFSDLGSEVEKKSSEKDQLTGHFQSFFLFLSPEQTVN